MLPLYITIFIISCLLLFWASSRLVGALMNLSKLLGWREFVVAFFTMAVAASLPNLIIGINSALHKIPQLSLGDVVGGNVIDLTLVIALAVLIGQRSLPAGSRMVQASAIFTTFVAILPLILLLDGTLGRGDGIILILTFFFYVFWLFSKEERFKKTYNAVEEDHITFRNKKFFRSLWIIAISILVIILASEGIVRSATFFAYASGLPLALIGILIVGLGNAMPELYFAIASARKKQAWMILGNSISSVVVPATLVLGIVSLIEPIRVVNFSPFAVGRIFLIIAAVFFLFAVRSGRKITRNEAWALLLIYLAFLALEIFLK